MKKIIIALAAVAALAACSKSNVEYSQYEEITFTPVAKNVTKAMMDEGKTFNIDEEFNVWAFYNPTVEWSETIDTWVSEYRAGGTNAKVYLDDKTFKYDDSYKLWAGKENAYFWPKVGSLAFAGYHPTSAPAAYALTADKNEMTFTDVTNSWVDNESEANTEDLMYFNLTKGYDKNNVTAVFKHALSWITVNVSTTQKTIDAGATITVSNVKFTEVMPQGDGTVVNQANIAWTPEGTPDVNGIETVESVVTLDATAQELMEPLFIPQTMDGDLEITYTITSDDSSSFTEKKVVTLNELKDKDGNDLSAWEAGKHYIYNIVISTEEILIAPEVIGWDDVEIPVTVQ